MTNGSWKEANRSLPWGWWGAGKKLEPGVSMAPAFELSSWKAVCCSREAPPPWVWPHELNHKLHESGDSEDPTQMLDIISLMEEIDKNTYQYILSFDSHHTLKIDMIIHHFTDGETEAQRGKGTGPRPHSYLVAGEGLEHI